MRMTDVFDKLCPECLGYGMGIAEFNACDHSELGMFLEGHRARERREAITQLACAVRANKMLGEIILLGLDGKPYNHMKRDFPELFEGDAKPKKQTWQEQEAILRRFLNMPSQPKGGKECKHG